MKAGTSHVLLTIKIRHTVEEQDILMKLILILDLLLSDYTKATTRPLIEILWIYSFHHCDLLSLKVSLISHCWPDVALSLFLSLKLGTSQILDLSPCFYCQFLASAFSFPTPQQPSIAQEMFNRLLFGSMINTSYLRPVDRSVLLGDAFSA